MPRIKPQDTAGNTSQRLNSDWCTGCGLYHHMHGQHRTDCTRKEKS